MKITLRIVFYRRGILHPKLIEINDKNYFEIRFILEKEAEKLKKHLKRFKQKGIIKSISKNPKVKEFKYKVQVKKIIVSRRSILQNLRTLRLHR